MSDESPTLRAQIIEAMRPYESRLIPANAELVFDEAIMPVLQKAMDAGALLVSKNTGPRISVPDAVKRFLDGILSLATQVQKLEATVSKRELLNMIYSMAANAASARTDIDAAS